MAFGFQVLIFLNDDHEFLCNSFVFWNEDAQLFLQIFIFGKLGSQSGLCLLVEWIKYIELFAFLLEHIQYSCWILWRLHISALDLFDLLFPGWIGDIALGKTLFEFKNCFVLFLHLEINIVDWVQALIPVEVTVVRTVEKWFCQNISIGLWFTLFHLFFNIYIQLLYLIMIFN